MKNTISSIGEVPALTAFISIAGRNSTKTGELTLASSEVIARRMTMGLFALFAPATADYKEFARMVPEKSKAFSDSGSVLFSKSMQIGQSLSRYFADEMGHTAKTMMAVWTSRHPMDVVAAQADGAITWFGRMAAESESICLNSLEAQGDAMAPIHKAATANVARLRQ